MDKPNSDLDALNARIADLHGRVTPAQRGPDAAGGGAGIGQGLRIAVEMVSVIGVGAVIGWGLDSWLDTKPVLFLVFFLLGAGAAFVNVYRIAQDLERRAQAARTNDNGRDDPGERTRRSRGE